MSDQLLSLPFWSVGTWVHGVFVAHMARSLAGSSGSGHASPDFGGQQCRELKICKTLLGSLRSLYRGYLQITISSQELSINMLTWFTYNFNRYHYHGLFRMSIRL